MLLLMPSSPSVSRPTSASSTRLENNARPPRREPFLTQHQMARKNVAQRGLMQHKKRLNINAPSIALHFIWTSATSHWVAEVW
jgi:hypothetical protein